MIVRPLVELGLVLAGFAAGTPSFEPARLLKGERPEVPVQAVGGGLVLLDASVDADGSVGTVRTVVSVSPYTQALRVVTPRFRFRAARAGEEPTPSHVLVAGYFRPPALMVTGPVVAPRDMPQPQVAMPASVTPPQYPPSARGSATVIVDTRIDPQGAVTSAVVIESAAGFDGAAVEAARAWRFEVPDDMGPRPASAVLVFVFREPADLGPAPTR